MRPSITAENNYPRNGKCSFFSPLQPKSHSPVNVIRERLFRGSSWAGKFQLHRNAPVMFQSDSTETKKRLEPELSDTTTWCHLALNTKNQHNRLKWAWSIHWPKPPLDSTVHTQLLSVPEWEMNSSPWKGLCQFAKKENILLILNASAKMNEDSPYWVCL